MDYALDRFERALQCGRVGDRTLDVLDAGLPRRVQVQDADVVLPLQVRGHECADVPGSADQQDGPTGRSHR